MLQLKSVHQWFPNLPLSWKTIFPRTGGGGRFGSGCNVSDGSGGNASDGGDGSGSNASDGKRQLKLCSLAQRSPPAVRLCS